MTDTNKNLDRIFDDSKKECIIRFISLTKQAVERLVPKGCYCHDENGPCPFWDKFDHYPEQMNGYCGLLERGDWMQDGGTTLIWDQCKECGINDDDESLYGPQDSQKEKQ